MTSEGHEPLTAGGLLDLAIDGLDLPSRTGESLDTWVGRLSGDRAQHHGREAVAAARRADYKTAREQAIQAETVHLAELGHPKGPSRV